LAFDRFMELALYAPSIGYYSGGAEKFGPGGDFVTAPEVSSLFGCCLARQAQQVLERLDGGDILEIGGGSGRLARDLLAQLERMDALPERYLILELSAELRLRQRDALADLAPHVAERVQWLNGFPEFGMQGLVIANEVVDAMPVSRFRVDDGGIYELFVVEGGDAPFGFQWRTPLTPGFAKAVERLLSRLGGLAPGYVSEINLRAGPWVASLAGCLKRGVGLIVDYGYTRREFYHPERSRGTLICHYRHRAHDNPLALVGIQDITASVDFSALAEVAEDAGLSVAGFVPQGHFLIAAGLEECIGTNPTGVRGHLQSAQEVKRLTLPSQMGERFKFLAVAADWDAGLVGFSLRDFRDRL